MTTNDAFGQTLATWLHEEAEHAMPDHLGEILVRTVAAPQRKWWSSPERWLPLDTTTRFRGRIAAPRALVWLAVLIAVLLAVVGTAIFTGALRTSTPINGLATNGRILVADGGSLRSLAADGTDPTVLLALPDGASNLSISPDGQRVAFGIPTDPASIQIVAVAGGTPVTVPMPAGVSGGDQIAWSPDGRQIAFPAFTGTEESLYVAPTDGGPAQEVGADAIDPQLGIWWPSWSPTGDQLAFVGVDKATETSGIFLIRPDGGGLTRLETRSLGSEPGPMSWSPEPGVRRLLYAAFDPDLSVYVSDLATGKPIRASGGFWPTWSPDGSRIAFWTDGTKVMTTSDALAGNPRRTAVGATFKDSCQAHPELAAKAFCGPATWSPDGTRLIAPDLTGSSILSVMADGSGKAIVVPIEDTTARPKGAVAWQPIRP